MTQEAEATHEKGVLRLDRPLPLQDNERVRLTIHTAPRPTRPGYGLIRRTGDPDVLRQIATSPEEMAFQLIIQSCGTNHNKAK